MKKLRSLKPVFLTLALMLLVLCVLPVQGQAAEVVAERKNEWVLTDDGVLTVKDGDMSSIYLNKYKDQILHVVVEDGVEESPDFYMYTAIKTVTLPDSVVTLNTFEGCTSLESIKLPGGITAIPEKMFSGCSSLKNVEIPNSVKEIGASAFSGCSALEAVVIPDGVTAIGNSAFQNCSALKEVVLPEGLTSTGSNTFSGCSGLKTVVLPESLTVIDQGAFYACTALTLVELPEGLESIGARAFSWCTAMETINWPESLTTIDNAAFHKCTSLKEVVLQRGVTIGAQAFYECTSLEKVILAEGTALDADGLQFGQCESLKTVTIPAGVTEIPESFVINSPLLEEIIIPDGVTKIGRYAFAFCDNVDRIYFPASVKYLGAAAFAYGGSNNIWEREWHVFFGGTEEQWGSWEIVDEKFEGENANQHLVQGHQVYLGDGFEAYCTDQCVKCSECDKHFNKDFQVVTHTFADGKCTACGAEKSATQPSEPTEPEATQPTQPTEPGGCTHWNTEQIPVDEANHNVRCKECGFVLGSEPHAYDEESKCVCGMIDPGNGPTVCKHENAEFEIADDLYHHYWCGDCKVVVGVDEPHTFEYTPDPVDENFHWMECSLCRFGKSVNHEFVDGKCVCGASDPSNTEPECQHEFTFPQALDDRLHQIVCENCKLVINAGEPHNFASAMEPCECGTYCKHSETEPRQDVPSVHSINCILCDAIIGNEEHTFVDGKCVCGEELTADNCGHANVEYVMADTDHNVRCKDCATVVRAEPHSYVDGQCVCGALGTSTEPEETEPTEPETEPTDPAPIKNPFVDVKDTEYYFDPVLWAVGRNITNGMDATHFAPDKTCTRGQIVTFLWRAQGEPEPSSTKNPFTDVKESDFFYKAVLWAVENGITKGTGENTFSPGADCTRAQVATFLWRSMGSPKPTSQTHSFKDLKNGEYYYDAVLWAVEKGVTNGVSATSFAPNSPCTRGQIVTFLYRALN